jgi:glycosyltransferase involved in cell wall biosynthesis
MNPTLSFILTAHNSEAFLAAAIDSALSQRLDLPFEVVVVDDASTDDTLRVIERYRKRFPDKIRIARNDENRGGGGARNRAIAEAHGDLFYVLDSDNIIPKGIGQAVLDRHREAGLHAASIECLKFFADKPGEPGDRWLLAHGDGVSSLRDMFESIRVPAAHGNYLFTRELFDAAGGYEEHRGAMDAWTFGLKHALKELDVAIAPGTFYFHRIGRADSFWTRDEKRGLNDVNAIAVLHEHLEELPADLRAKVELLDHGDRLFAHIDAGLFRLETSQEEFEAQLRRSRLAAQDHGRGLLRRLLSRRT